MISGRGLKDGRDHSRFGFVLTFARSGSSFGDERSRKIDDRALQFSFGLNFRDFSVFSGSALELADPSIDIGLFGSSSGSTEIEDHEFRVRFRRLIFRILDGKLSQAKFAFRFALFPLFREKDF